MQKLFYSILGMLGVLLASTASAQNINYLTAKPLSTAVTASLRNVSTSSTVKVPIITWGGDMATVLAKEEGLFAKQGLNVSLFREDNFTKQVSKCLSGETPYLRGTMGMINAASEVFKKNNMELVVIYQMTWSVGGDAMVVRSGKNLKNIKTVAAQLYGPHMDYAANLFNKVGRLNRVSFKWLPELTLPTVDTRGKIVDPVSAFQSDTKLDATMCIIPDALMLTSNGAVGTGAEGSVKGAKILLSTKTAGRIIADVYAVRKDYFDANKSKVMNFVKALMQAEESIRKVKKSPSGTKYRSLMSKSAEIFFGASQASADAAALLGDCEFVGYNGNVSFFTGKGTSRNFTTLNREIQGAFKSMGLMTGSVSLKSAGWNFASLKGGLSSAGSSNAPVKKKFDKQKVTSKVEEKILAETTSWEEEGTLFVVEINFAPNQSEFSASKYAGDFQKALEIAETYSGALIVIEGHSDPLGVLKSERDGDSKQVINAKRQKAKNLSYQRSQNVRSNFIAYCKQKGIKIDESQFVAVGFGTKTPKYNPPKTKDEWAANRRVVFRIKQVEAELEEFVPLD